MSPLLKTYGTLSGRPLIAIHCTVYWTLTI